MAPPQIYLSYSAQDLESAEEIYRRLADAGFRPWLYSREIQPGEEWEERIVRAIRASDLFLPLISEYWAGPGYFHREVELAIQLAQERRPDRVFLIPVMIRPTYFPENVRRYHGIFLYQEDGWENLLRSVSRAFALEALPPPEPPEGLVQAFVEGESRPFLYIGAGLSAPMGLPMWRPLAQRLLEWAEDQGVIPSTLLASLYQALEAGDTDLVADCVVEMAHKRPLVAFLRELFTGQQAVPGANHRRLRDLGPGAVMTTNFDDLLEQTFAGAPVFTHLDTESLLDALASRQSFVLKLYGTLDRPESVLVAPKQYEDEIVGNLAFSQFMENVFVSRTLLFLGASLEGIEAYLRGVKFRGKLSRQHYALVAVSDKAWKAKAEALRRRYQIEVIPYTVSHDYHEVDHFLEALLQGILDKTGDSSRGSAHSRRNDEPARIAKIHLEKIGPFTDLTMALDAHWNILLGNNGVGKSSILRAIATALCGRDAQPFADRLIQFGQPGGKIILQTEDGKEYVTQMNRTSSVPQIDCMPGRMLDIEGGLSLGFPALRTVTWRRTRGPQLDEARLRPNPEDLLPLVGGGPDPRVDLLKQWIVDIDYRIKDDTGRNRDRYARLLNEFFRVIGELTGGLQLEFSRVDRERGQVLLQTNDGEVPLESVSQGTVSLFGWIGVLMQRLYEVYGAEERPIERYALVLIDEIDAHMHPYWQLRLIPLLRKAFPTVQFLATTHSPLVVCNAGDGAVFRCERDETTQLLAARRQRMRPAGLGAEGLLTSDYFGLHTQLDDQTQRLLDQKVSYVAQEGTLSEEDRRDLEILNRQLDEIGLLTTFADPYYTAFLRGLARRKELQGFKEPVYSREDLERRERLIADILAELDAEESDGDALR